MGYRETLPAGASFNAYRQMGENLRFLVGAGGGGAVEC